MPVDTFTAATVEPAKIRRVGVVFTREPVSETFKQPLSNCVVFV